MEARQIKVAIYDSTYFYSYYLKVILSQSGIGGLEVYRNRDKLFIELPMFNPDIVICVLNNRIVEEINIMEDVKSLLPKSTLVVMGWRENLDFVERILYRADIYLTKSISPEEFITAIKTLSETGSYSNKLMFEVSSLPKKSDSNLMPNITPREIELMKLAAEGLNAKEIALIMKISNRTVEEMKASMIRRTGSRSFIGVVLYTVKHNLV